MKTISNLLIVLVVLLHIGILVMEMFLWTTPIVRDNFGLTLEQATFSAPLAANQGLYNGFLAAGLFWGWMAKQESFSLKVFFLTCIIIAGIYGAMTVKLSILYVQSLPAAIALILVWFEQYTHRNVKPIS
jgi:putative membrane protein